VAISSCYLGWASASFAVLVLTGGGDSLEVEEPVLPGGVLLLLGIILLFVGRWVFGVIRTPPSDPGRTDGGEGEPPDCAMPATSDEPSASAESSDAVGGKEAPEGAEHPRDLDGSALEEIRVWVDDMLDRYSSDELSRSARLFVLPNRYFMRAVQTVDAGDLSTKHRVSRDVRLPGNYLKTEKKTRFLIPILVLPKGRIIDSLDIDVGGSRGRTLGYGECQGFVSWLAWIVMRKASIPVAQRLEALAAVRSDAPTSVPACVGAWTTGSSKWGPVAAELVKTLAWNRVILVETENIAGARVQANVGWTSHDDDRFRTVTDRARAFLGLGSTSLSGPVVGQEAASWHLRIATPEGTYVRRAEFETAGSGMEPDLMDNGVRGQDIAHFRLRSRPSERALTRFRVYVGETPPGLGGPITILSGALMSIMLVGFYLYAKVFPPFGSEPLPDCKRYDIFCDLDSLRISTAQHSNSLAATAILAAIAAASAWLIGRFDVGSVRRAQIREVCALFGVLVLSLLSVMSASLRTVFRLWGQWTVPFWPTHLVLRYPGWTLLTTASCGIFFLALSSLVVRYFRLRDSRERAAGRSF